MRGLVCTCGECRKCKRHAWIAANREKVNAGQRAYRKKNVARMRELGRRYRNIQTPRQKKMAKLAQDRYAASGGRLTADRSRALRAYLGYYSGLTGYPYAEAFPIFHMEMESAARFKMKGRGENL